MKGASLSLPRSQIRAFDGLTRRGSDEQQCLRTARSHVCRAHPSRVKGESVSHCNRRRISQELAEPIKRSAYPFCHGERNDVGRSRMPIARTRALNATPNALSLSRMRYFGALSQGNASVICRANHSAIGLRVTATTTTIAGDGREQETRIVAERQSSEPQTDQSRQSPPYD